MGSIKYTIATLGSHSALQILKGAHDEGFPTLLITTSKRRSFYERFSFIDEFLEVENFADFPKFEKDLKKRNIILIPHGSFVAYLGKEGNKNISLPYFGNKKVLDWEENRKLQMDWMQAAHLRVPREFSNGNKIDRPVIVKSYGAEGGAGYFVAHSQEDFEHKIKSFSKDAYLVQEYVIGVPMYLHYFYSPLTGQIELMSIDRRYESNVDSLGRMPLAHQESIDVVPSFVVVGNSPLAIRESLMPEAYEMGEKVVEASKKMVDKRGIFGPFCLETIITQEQKFYIIEISCRIVAGTNLYIEGSPYSALLYDEPMSTGRRIAREIKHAIEQDRLELILD